MTTPASRFPIPSTAREAVITVTMVESSPFTFRLPHFASKALLNMALINTIAAALTPIIVTSYTVIPLENTKANLATI